MSCYQLGITIANLAQKQNILVNNNHMMTSTHCNKLFCKLQIQGTAYLQLQAKFSDYDKIY